MFDVFWIIDIRELHRQLQRIALSRRRVYAGRRPACSLASVGGMCYCRCGGGEALTDWRFHLLWQVHCRSWKFVTCCRETHWRYLYSDHSVDNQLPKINLAFVLAALLLITALNEQGLMYTCSDCQRTIWDTLWNVTFLLANFTFQLYNCLCFTVPQANNWVSCLLNEAVPTEKQHKQKVTYNAKLHTWGLWSSLSLLYPLPTFSLEKLG